LENNVTVKELVEYLQKQQQDMRVAYRLFSEQVLIEQLYIGTDVLCGALPDGWIQDSRKDKPLESYLVFPGN
jgi:hypothetical protein